MAKSRRSPNPEFLAKRRKTIAELAKQRRQREGVRASGISADRKAEAPSRGPFARTTTPSQA